MKKLLIYLVFFLLNLSAKATLPVVDYSHIAQDAANEVVNLAKYAQTAIASAQTELNTLNTYENTVVQVARFGNPAALRNLPGISSVAELYQLYSQLSRNVVTAQALLNPHGVRALHGKADCFPEPGGGVGCKDIALAGAVPQFADAAGQALLMRLDAFGLCRGFQLVQPLTGGFAQLHIILDALCKTLLDLRVEIDGVPRQAG